MQGSDCEGRLSERPVPEAGSAASSTRRADKRWRTVSGRLRYLPHRCSTLCGEFEEELVQDRTSLHGRAESRGPPSDFCSSRRHSLPVPRRSKTGRLSVQPSALRTILFTFILHFHFVHLSKKTYSVVRVTLKNTFRYAQQNQGSRFVFRSFLHNGASCRSRMYF